MGVAISMLKRAKEAGAPGFRGHRVYPSELRPWLKKRQGELGKASLKESLECRRLAAQCEKFEIDNAVSRKEYVPAADVEKWGADLGMEIKKVVNQLHLIAPSVVGLSVPDAEIRLRELEDEVMSKLHLLGDRMDKMKKEKIP